MTRDAAPGTRSRATPVRLLSGILIAAGVALVAVYLLTFAIRNTGLQWDFKTYLLAAHAAHAGLDPYSAYDLSAVAGRRISQPFLYPPVTLVPFSLLALLPTASAAVVWMVLKVVLLAGLVALWHRLAPWAGLLAIALVAVFGWNGAALWDLRTGNVAIVETALLWVAFAAYAADRRTVFAALAVAAACFKLTPAAFLLLLLIPAAGRRPDAMRFVGALAALVAIVFVPFAVPPAAHWAGFLRHVPGAATLGDSNPSSLGFLTVLVHTVGVPGAAGILWGRVAWVAYAIALIGISMPFLRRAWRAGNPLRWAMIAVFLDLLLAPRPMAYGFVLLAPAPFFFLPRPFNRPGGALLLALVLSAQGLFRAASLQPNSLAVIYAPFLLTLAVWLLVVQSEASTKTAR